MIHPAKALRAGKTFSSEINVIWAVQPLLKKYFCFSEDKSLLYSKPSRPTKGAYRDRRETRGGMRWTRQRQARKCYRRAGFP
jgi:hypothetical protein